LDKKANKNQGGAKPLLFSMNLVVDKS